jgi:hypothetical protein
MTKDDIIRMAKEAAAQHGHTIKPTDEIVETLTSFYHLIAAAERERLAKYFDAHPYYEQFGNQIAVEIREGGES